MRMPKRKLFWCIPLGILGFAAFIAVGGAVVMLLWNWLAPAIFGWKSITFWEAVGILALCRILFGGRGHGFRGFRNRRRRMMQERWEKMTPEEREKLRQAMRGRCGWSRQMPTEDTPTEIAPPA